MTRYRVTFAIERQQDGEDDFTEVGFGSSTGEPSIDAALYYVQSVIDNRQWETSQGMPDPADA